MPSGVRPHIAPDWGGRGCWWVFGAFEPSTGMALTACSMQRRTTDFVAFLERLVQHWSQGELILILDNLAVHKTLEVRLWAVVHPQVRFLFQPTYSPWLNLIEPWWKTLRSLALKGRRFDFPTDIPPAIAAATHFWNQQAHPYQWRKAA
jgi:transposase